MYLVNIFLLRIFGIVECARISFVIRDYFVYKNVTRVAGFSCGDIEDDLLTVKLLNAANISVAIKPAGFQVDVLRYLDTDRILGVFLDIRCPSQNVSSVFDIASANRMFDYSYNWLILGSNMNHSQLSLNDTGFSIVTDLVILLPDGSDYVLYDVYNHCKIRGGLLNVTALGTWREDDGLVITLTGTKISRRRNYHGLRIIAGGIVIARPQNVSLIEYLESDNTFDVMDYFSKFGHTLLSHVSNIYNFSMDLIGFDNWEKNDSVGPLMGSLKKGEIDLGYYPSISTLERYEYARVILQLLPTRTCFMFRTIPAMKVKPLVILKPFDADTWYVIIVIIVIIVLILSVILKLERAAEYDGCSISALIAVAALCQQGIPSLSNQYAARIAFMQITVFGLLVFNYYSAAIVSARLNEPLHKMNDSLYSLVHSKMPLAAEKMIYLDFLMRNPRPDVQYFKQHWNTIPESKRLLSIEDGVKRIKKGGFAYHGDPDFIYPTIEREFDTQMICQLTEVHLLQPTELSVWSNLNSHFHEVSKIGFMKVSTAGLRRRELRRRSARKPYCPSDEIFVSSVTIYEAAPILILLLLGMIISLIVFIIEHLIFNAMNSKCTPSVAKKDKIPLSKKNNMFLKSKAPPRNNAILLLPEASKLFQKVLMTKRY